ncbi:MAG: zinc-ribbon domain-containing protein, partial [Pyrinomonadaceae bacterium]
MTEAILEKAVCEQCGVAVRENTLFCYNCGSSVSNDPVDNAATGVADNDSGVAADPDPDPD